MYAAQNGAELSQELPPSPRMLPRLRRRASPIRFTPDTVATQASRQHRCQRIGMAAVPNNYLRSPCGDSGNCGKRLIGAAGGDRTHDPWLRRPILYPLSYSRPRALGQSPDCLMRRWRPRFAQPGSFHFHKPRGLIAEGNVGKGRQRQVENFPRGVWTRAGPHHSGTPSSAGRLGRISLGNLPAGEPSGRLASGVCRRVFLQIWAPGGRLEWSSFDGHVVSGRPPRSLQLEPQGRILKLDPSAPARSRQR